MIDPLDHVMVVSAMSRMARLGGWARILARKPLEDEIDFVDAELLLAAGVLRRTDDECLEPVHPHPWHFEPEALAAGTLSLLRRAIHHAEGHDTSWSGHAIEVAVAQGVASTSAATVVGESLLPQMPEAHAAFLSGHACFLDVGVGTAAFATRLCQLYPGTRAVGLDVHQPVLDRAATHTADAHLSEQIELRLESVADLEDESRYHLAWMPQGFIPPTAFTPGLRAVHRALLPGGWLVLLLAAAPTGADPFQRAVQAHTAHLTGGGPVTPSVVVDLLGSLNFEEVREIGAGDQTLLLARRPLTSTDQAPHWSS